MVFRSVKDFETYVLKKTDNAVKKAQEKVYKILDLYLQRFYNEYDPVVYERTYQLMKSLVKSDVRKVGNEVKAEVYFNLSYIYNTGANPSAEQVMAAADYGRHGAMGLAVADFKGTSIWHESLAMLDAEAISTLKNMLIAEGIPIR